jgi:hypothetical protein
MTSFRKKSFHLILLAISGDDRTSRSMGNGALTAKRIRAAR